MIDRVHFADPSASWAWAFGIDGTKHPLGGYGASEGSGRQFTCPSQYSSLTMSGYAAR